MKEPNINLILFDGVCNLCNGWIQFIIKRDPKAKFRFCALQSKSGKDIIANLDLNMEGIDSIIYIRGNGVYLKSEAALMILKDMGGFWKISLVMMIFPRFIRDYVYDLVAANRYNLSLIHI